MRRLACTVLLLLAVAPLTACSFTTWHRADKAMSLSSDHVAGSALEVRSRNGRIEVAAVPNRSDVSIEARLYTQGNSMAEAEERLAATTLAVSRAEDGTLVVEPKFPEPVRGGDGASITIELPDADGATLDTSNGSVHAFGLTGRLVVDTSNGSVEVVGHKGDAKVDTSNGRITVDDHVGALRLDTSNASIHVSNVDGPVEADTSNASIHLTMAGTQAGPLDLDTNNGSITVRVGAGFLGPVTLKTSNGSLTVADYLGRITSQTISRSTGRIVVGEGGQPSRLDTSNGRIRFTIAG